MPISRKRIFVILAVALISGLLPGNDPRAEIYRFRDKNGQWHFSDAPPEAETTAVETMQEPHPDNGFENLAQKLTTEFPPETGVEKAALAVVTIYSPVGKGSGFFITAQGHILTSRHVLEGDKDQMAKAESDFTMRKERLEYQEASLHSEEGRLEQTRTELEKMKAATAGIGNEAEQRQALGVYEDRLAKYQAGKAKIEQQRQLQEKQKAELNHEHNLFRSMVAEAGVARQFTVIAKDGQELHAYLIRSSTHDLALLKIDGYHTPCLEPADPAALGQGSEVYAIGSPATLRDSVCRGIVSGLEGGFIKTDAHIYPGNSGGPLVTTDGRVAGIIAFKKLTVKFEGLGFAIPIQAALEDFSQEIGAYVSP